MLPKLQIIAGNFEKPNLNKTPDSLEEPKVISDEYFIQQAFLQSPNKGFELLFLKYYANLCSNAIRLVHSKELAEDVVAEVFTNFWQNKVYEAINSSYRSYLYKAVRFRAYNCIKFELQRTTNFEMIDFDNQNHETPVLKPDEILHFHELSHKIDFIIQKLPTQSKKAFQMNRLEGKKYAEVADELQITVSAVERLISRALTKLREELKTEWIINK